MADEKRKPTIKDAKRINNPVDSARRVSGDVFGVDRSGNSAFQPVGNLVVDRDSGMTISGMFDRAFEQIEKLALKDESIKEILTDIVDRLEKIEKAVENYGLVD
jgi:hypothetical protein